MVGDLFAKQSSDKGGFGYIATREISPGTMLLQESAFFAIKIENNLTFKSKGCAKSFCSHCLSIKSLKFHLNCKNQCEASNIRFCSFQCKQKFKNCHSVLCTPSKNSSPASIETTLATKMILDTFPSAMFEVSSGRKEPSKFKKSEKELLSVCGESKENLLRISKNIYKIDPKNSPSEYYRALLANLETVFGYSFSMRLMAFDDIPYALALFEKAAFFNHSCRPNCHVVFSTNQIKIFATHRIPPGEELCFSYVSNFATVPFRRRKNFLAENFGFDCLCQFCRKEQMRLCSGANGGIEESFDEETLKLHDLYTQSEELFINADFKGYWDTLFPAFNKAKTFDLSLYEIVDKLVNMALLCKKYREGVGLVDFAKKLLEFHKNKLSAEEKGSKVDKVGKTGWKNKNKEKYSKRRAGPVLRDFVLLELKMLLMEMVFKISLVRTEEDYFEFQEELFSTAKTVNLLLAQLFGQFGGKFVEELSETHGGFASVQKILSSVEGYFAE